LQEPESVGFTWIALSTDSACDEPYMDHKTILEADKASLMKVKNADNKKGKQR